jgi:hypothetical protein
MAHGHSRNYTTLTDATGGDAALLLELAEHALDAVVQRFFKLIEERYPG